MIRPAFLALALLVPRPALAQTATLVVPAGRDVVVPPRGGLAPQGMVSASSQATPPRAASSRALPPSAEDTGLGLSLRDAPLAYLLVPAAAGLAAALAGGVPGGGGGGHAAAGSGPVRTR